MINVLVLIAMLAMGSPSSTVIRDHSVMPCEYVDTCGHNWTSASWGIGYVASSKAQKNTCYAGANISLHDLSILPNDNVLVSCITVYNGIVSYTVVYRVSGSMIGIDSWVNGVQSSRVIEALTAQ